MMCMGFTRVEADRIAFKVAVECAKRQAVEKLWQKANGNVASEVTVCCSGIGIGSDRNMAHEARGKETTDRGQTNNQ